MGYSTASAARAAVTASSVTLGPGEMAEVLVAFDPPPDLVVSDGASIEQDVLALSVRYLGLPSIREVPLLSEPLVLVPASTAARLEREGRLAPQG